MRTQVARARYDDRRVSLFSPNVFQKLRGTASLVLRGAEDASAPSLSLLPEKMAPPGRAGPGALALRAPDLRDGGPGPGRPQSSGSSVFADMRQITARDSAPGDVPRRGDPDIPRFAPAPMVIRDDAVCRNTSTEGQTPKLPSGLVGVLFGTLRIAQSRHPTDAGVVWKSCAQ